MSQFRNPNSVPEGRWTNYGFAMPDVILPCLNEAPALPDLLKRMPSGWNPIVADNGSTDGSAQIALDHGAQVVHVAVRGYGAAAHAGLEAATSDIVGFMDADGTLDPVDLNRVAAPIVAGTADLVLGRRRPTSRHALSTHSRAGNAYLARRVRLKTGFAIHDLGPMRVGKREALLDLELKDRRFGWPLEMISRAAVCGLRVTEVDVPYGPRMAGTASKVTGTIGGTLRTVRDMSRVLPK